MAKEVINQLREWQLDHHGEELLCSWVTCVLGFHFIDYRVYYRVSFIELLQQPAPPPTNVLNATGLVYPYNAAPGYQQYTEPPTLLCRLPVAY